LAARNKDIANIGVKFGAGQPNTLGGRKKDRINEVWAILGVTNDEDKVIIMSKEEKYKFIQGLFEMTLDQLHETASNPKMPVFMVSIVRALISDIEKGVIWTVNSFFDRFYGKAPQSLELSGDNAKPLVTVVKFQDDDGISDKIE
jgi:hypothetical protein